MVSKALDRSKNIPIVCNWLSVAFAILSINVSNEACEVDCFFLKPNWEFKRTLNSLKKISAREYTNRSSILETDVKRNIGR